MKYIEQDYDMFISFCRLSKKNLYLRKTEYSNSHVFLAFFCSTNIFSLFQYGLRRHKWQTAVDTRPLLQQGRWTQRISHTHTHMEHTTS